MCCSAWFRINRFITSAVIKQEQRVTSYWESLRKKNLKLCAHKYCAQKLMLVLSSQHVQFFLACLLVQKSYSEIT